MTAHRYTPDSARAAGKIGGQASHAARRENREKDGLPRNLGALRLTFTQRFALIELRDYFPGSATDYASAARGDDVWARKQTFQALVRKGLVEGENLTALGRKLANYYADKLKADGG